MNKDNAFDKIPAPTIIFDHKGSLKRRSHTARIVWLSVSAAAAIAVALVLVVPSDTTLPQPSAVQQVAVQADKPRVEATDSVKHVPIENTNSKIQTVKTENPIVKKSKPIPTPPPEVKKQEVEERIEQIRRRELPADIPVQLGSCLAQVKGPDKITVPEVRTIKPELNIISASNNNLVNFINQLRPEKSDDYTTVLNIISPKKAKDYEIVPLFSKK